MKRSPSPFAPLPAANDPEPEPPPVAAPAPDPAEPDLAAVAALRARLWTQGYRPLAVLSGTKRPLGRGWQIAARQLRPEAASTPAIAEAASTGILCDGLRAVDVDVDDPARAEQVVALAHTLLGAAPCRSRPDSPRCLLLYRAAEGAPPKRTLHGLRGAVEVLGSGQQFVAFGQHPDGARYQWSPASPADVPAADLPPVTERQVGAFLAAVAPIIGAGTDPFGPGPDGTAPADDGLVFDTGRSWQPLDHAAAEDAIAAGNGSHDAALRLAGSLAAEGLGATAIEERLRAAYMCRPAAGRDQGWHAAVADLPRLVAGVMAKEAAKSHTGNTGNTVAGPDGADAPWPDPDLAVLDPRRRPPAAADDVLGPQLATWTRQAAAACAAPADYVLATLLSIASVLIGNARWPEAATATKGDWREPPHLWCVLVGDSGDGKTPGANTLLRDVLPQLETRMEGDAPERRARWQEAADTAEATREAWKAALRKAIKEHAAPPPAPPPFTDVEPQRPRISIRDATIERVAGLLAAAAPKGLLVVRDEWAGWVESFQQYNKSARQTWLESWNGGVHTVDRQPPRPEVTVPHLSVAVLGGVQPERLAEIIASSRDDGLLARHMFFWPDPLPFRLGTRADTAWITETLDRLRLLDLDPDPTGDPRIPPHRRLVPLDADAVDILEAFGAEMQQAGRATTGLLRSALAKAPGLALRLSGVLTLLGWAAETPNGAPEPETITAATVRAACAFVRGYAMPMAARVYGDAATPAAERNSAALARWIVAERPPEVHARTLLRKVRLPGLRDADAIRGACAELVEAGWLRPAPGAVGFQRRSRVAWAINPRLWEAVP